MEKGKDATKKKEKIPVLKKTYYTVKSVVFVGIKFHVFFKRLHFCGYFSNHVCHYFVK